MANITNFHFKDKKALIRVDFNVPLDDKFHITDDTRIKAALPTIQKVISEGGSVILMSHLGRPKGSASEKYSLKHLIAHLSTLLNGVAVKFSAACIGQAATQASQDLKAGEVLLLENLRFHQEEEKGDEAFAKSLASLGDVYINDAFGTAHRAHASTAIIAKFFDANSRMFGYLMEAEVNNAEKVMHNSEYPFTAIIGGAKVSDKILIIEMLLNKASNIIIGGGMAYTFLKSQGFNVGSSLCENDKLDLANELLNKAKLKGVNFYLPLDSIMADQFSPEAQSKEVENADMSDGWMGLDIGSKTIGLYQNVVLNSKTILWNGPMGVFEFEKFQNGTKEIALAIAEATRQGAFSLIGGGDSVAAINKFHLANDVSYVSTGGGALLEYFEGKELPGITAMKA
ncbi:MAG: phosphoglycerate kinase [Chitinophagaceae bacterium]|nr:MAG: phosphoglycerate kinase [Bacteroidetes bacterium OLB11]MCC6447172.1 phosphoglycerate kinase [Chitinophagaceae bacterium]HMN31999.1 phosphoglycerate kinase [Chitinophagaceae bacterium]